ncbi:hypothetical protein ACFLRQ_02705 [Bacteroidota bacterium]
MKPIKKNTVKKLRKTCVVCEAIFYAKTDRAFFCCNSCKQKFHFTKKAIINDTYFVNPNHGRKLPAATLPTLQFPEDKKIFEGDYTGLKEHLLKYISIQDYINEKIYIDGLIPVVKSKDYCESSCQIFSDTYFMEVFRINNNFYKFYGWKWGPDNEKPFVSN